jgi:hypothetical protein
VHEDIGIAFLPDEAIAVCAKSFMTALRLKLRRWRLIPQKISRREFKVDCL